MRRRLLSLFLILAMLTAFCVPALAANEAVLKVNVPEGGVKAGETFTVTVELTGNPGFNSVQFTLGYDGTKMTCKKASTGAVLSGVLAATNPKANGGAKIAATSVEQIKQDGVIATFSVKAEKDMKEVNFSLNDVKLLTADDKSIAYRIEGSSESSGNAKPSGTKPADKPSAGATKIDFPDISKHWARLNIIRAAELGLFSGYTDGRFGPDDTVTRVQFVTVLWRLAGRPEPKATAPFTDMGREVAEFKTAVAWAYETKCVSGRTATTFDPRGPITREEAMAVLFRFNGGVSGMEVMFTSVYDESFTDSGSIHSYARAPIYWGVYNGLISGMTETTLAPRGVASRAQLATILVNYIDKFSE